MAFPPGAEVFELRREVQAEDLDTQAHVNNVVYVRWVQDVAVGHWEARTTHETRTEVGWALLRHEIDYHKAALLGDHVALRTAVGHLEGLTFERWVEIRRVEDDTLLARSRTLWCPIDMRTGRPRRLSKELRAVFSHISGQPEGATAE